MSIVERILAPVAAWIIAVISAAVLIVVIDRVSAGSRARA
jgi:hypothetical protein